MRATRSRTVRRAAWTTAGLALSALVTSGSGASAAAAASDEGAEQPIGSTRLISRGFDGKPAGDDSHSVSVSDDGRYVAFQSWATDIVDSPHCEVRLYGCIYLHDRVTGETVLVSVSPTGQAPTGNVGNPHISGDGSYVAYDSTAKNLVPGDRNRKTDVFVYDREAATTKLISRNPDGKPANGHSGGPVLSRDGGYVVYHSNARDLVEGDRGGPWGVVRTDLVTGTTIVVSLRPDGRRPREDSSALDVSVDGRIVTYRTDSADIAPGDDNGLFDVFAYDVETGTTELVSRAPDGSVADGNSAGGSISDDGRFVTFWSDAADLVPPDTLGHYDVYRLDRASGELQRVTVGTGGDPANGWSGQPTISADGTLITFASDATDLGAGGLDAVTDVFVTDLAEGTTEIVTRGRHDTPPDADSEYPFLSADGSVVAYASHASNLVRGDRNDVRDVFVYRRL